ncbi:hypothetical protein T12_6700 [Trichinella patagoniensis]|uniref:Uncharacterized protein n=1 Tax=Trichinella patagoniensis TaxID=990121 RepID=A0A0V1AC64_9BILA|nr:hypothetical protein T12_6700 [Trichinella patagoniensis]
MPGGPPCDATAQPVQPRMAALPRDRVVQTPAFSQVGMKLAGPLFVSVGRRATSPIYVCLITCMVTRSVHLEVVPHGQSTASPSTFMAREDGPKTIQSDNFRSLQGAASCCRPWTRTGTRGRELVGHRIQWKFIPEKAP